MDSSFEKLWSSRSPTLPGELRAAAQGVVSLSDSKHLQFTMIMNAMEVVMLLYDHCYIAVSVSCCKNLIRP